MNWFHNMPMRRKIVSLVIIMEILLCIVGYMGYYYINRASKDMAIMSEQSMVSVQVLNDSRNQMRAVQADVFELMLTVDHGRNKNLQDDIKQRATIMDSNLEKYEKSNLLPEEKGMLDAVRTDLSKYRAARRTVIDLTLQNKNAEAYQYYVQQVEGPEDQAISALHKLAQYNIDLAVKTTKETEAAAEFAKRILAVIILGSIVGGLVIGWMIAENVAMSLKAAALYVNKLAQGDFSVDVSQQNVERKDEIGVLFQATQQLTHNTRELIGRIANSATQVAASSEELTAGAGQAADAANSVAVSINEMAEGAHQQATAVQETSAVAEEMSASIEEIVATATDIAEMANTSVRTTNDGQQVIQQAVSQMGSVGEKSSNAQTAANELKQSSQQIGEIVGLISTIAGQTNLLALNAAIEAARAGEQGRGFAVVAEEVRKLAEQSEAAARQITELIASNHQSIDNVVNSVNDAIMNIDEGIKLVNNAGEGFQQIDTLVNQVAEQIGNISVAIEEVAQGSQKIVGSFKQVEELSHSSSHEVANISAATEEQLASTQEIAASSRMLSDLAESLREAVHKFKV